MNAVRPLSPLTVKSYRETEGANAGAPGVRTSYGTPALAFLDLISFQPRSTETDDPEAEPPYTYDGKNSVYYPQRCSTTFLALEVISTPLGSAPKAVAFET